MQGKVNKVKPILSGHPRGIAVNKDENYSDKGERNLGL